MFKKLLAVLLSAALTLLVSTCAYPEKAPPPDYLGMMQEAAVAGDRESGHLAQYARDREIDESGSGQVKVDFDELYLLSRYIYVEAGGRFFSDEQRMCTGEIALNRVASPDYPDSLEAVIYQAELCAAASTRAFQTELRPSRACVQTAMRLLLGERMLAPEVVLCSDKAVGRVYAEFCRRVGYDYAFTYYCAPEQTAEQPLPS